MKYNEQYELYKKLLWISKRGSAIQKSIGDLVRNSIQDLPLWNGDMTLTGTFLIDRGDLVPWADVSVIGKDGQHLRKSIKELGEIPKRRVCPIKINFHFVNEDNLLAQAQWAREYLASYVLSHVELGRILAKIAKGADAGKAFARAVDTKNIPHLKLMVDKQLI